MKNQGFTLIELMIVVVIIGILAAIAIPKFTAVARSAKEAEAEPILRQLYTLQERYWQRWNEYATSISDLEGGTASFNHGKYYDFQLSSGTTSGYVACAAPKPGLDLSYFTIDSDRNIARRAGGCS